MDDLFHEVVWNGLPAAVPATSKDKPKEQRN